MAGTDPPIVATGVTDARLVGLRRWNLGLTVLHLAQAVLVLVLADGFAIAVTSSFPQGPPGTPVPAPETLFDVRSAGPSRSSSAWPRSTICPRPRRRAGCTSAI